MGFSCLSYVLDSEMSYVPAEDKMKTEVQKTEIEHEKIAEDMDVDDFHKQKPCIHTLLFGSEFVSVDDVGNVLVSSLPELPLDSNSKYMLGGSLASEYPSMHDSKVNSVKGIPSSHLRLPELENLLESSPCNSDAQKGKLSSWDKEIPEATIASRMLEEKDITCEEHNVMHDRTVVLLPDESSDDVGDCELSPRLTNFIESGIVPESPVNSPGLYLQNLFWVI